MNTQLKKPDGVRIPVVSAESPDWYPEINHCPPGRRVPERRKTPLVVIPLLVTVVAGRCAFCPLGRQ